MFSFLSDNDVRVALELIAVLALYLQSRRQHGENKAGTEAAQTAAAQLTNNGGSSALDKIDQIVNRLEQGDARFATIDATLSKIAEALNPTRYIGPVEHAPVGEHGPEIIVTDGGDRVIEPPNSPRVQRPENPSSEP